MIGTEQGILVPLKKNRVTPTQAVIPGREYSSVVIMGKEKEKHHGPI